MVLLESFSYKMTLLTEGSILLIPKLSINPFLGSFSGIRFFSFVTIFLP